MSNSKKYFMGYLMTDYNTTIQIIFTNLVNNRGGMFTVIVKGKRQISQQCVLASDVRLTKICGTSL